MNREMKPFRNTEIHFLHEVWKEIYIYIYIYIYHNYSEDSAVTMTLYTIKTLINYISGNNF
jgi:hypothetical protein